MSNLRNPYQQMDLFEELEMDQLFRNVEEALQEEERKQYEIDEEEMSLFWHWSKERRLDDLNRTVTTLNPYTATGRKEVLKIYNQFLTYDLGLMILMFAGSVMEVPFPYKRLPKLVLPREVMISFNDSMLEIEMMSYYKVATRHVAWSATGEDIYVREPTIRSVSDVFCMACGELCFPYQVEYESKCNCGKLGHKNTNFKGRRTSRIVGGFCYNCVKDNQRFMAAMHLTLDNGITQIGF